MWAKALKLIFFVNFVGRVVAAVVACESHQIFFFNFSAIVFPLCWHCGGLRMWLKDFGSAVKRLIGATKSGSLDIRSLSLPPHCGVRVAYSNFG